MHVSDAPKLTDLPPQSTSPDSRHYKLTCAPGGNHIDNTAPLHSYGKVSLSPSPHIWNETP
jgi:hypothetical protein